MLGTFQIPRGSGAIDQTAQRRAQLGLCLCLCRRMESARQAGAHSSRHDCQVSKVFWCLVGVHQSNHARKQSCGRREVNETRLHVNPKNPYKVIQPDNYNTV